MALPRATTTCARAPPGAYPSNPRAAVPTICCALLLLFLQPYPRSAALALESDDVDTPFGVNSDAGGGGGVGSRAYNEPDDADEPDYVAGTRTLTATPPSFL
jgi:hypothetical protein